MAPPATILDESATELTREARDLVATYDVEDVTATVDEGDPVPGRRLAYTYQEQVLEPGERLVMRTSAGPFPMETTYRWEDALEGGTRMTLRNRGEPAGFAKVAAPVLAAQMRRANRKDLERLKQILER